MRAQVMRMVERMAIAVVVMMMALELAAPMTAMAATPDQTAAERAIATQVSQMAGATDVQTRMAALQAIYPEGTPWTEANEYHNLGVYNCYMTGCSAFALLASDAAYGPTASVTRLANQTPADIRVGDIVRLNGVHSVFVISATADAITVCEGNYNVSVHWGRTISRSSMNGQITYILRRDL